MSGILPIHTVEVWIPKLIPDDPPRQILPGRDTPLSLLCDAGPIPSQWLDAHDVYVARPAGPLVRCGHHSLDQTAGRFGSPAIGNPRHRVGYAAQPGVTDGWLQPRSGRAQAEPLSSTSPLRQWPMSVRGCAGQRAICGLLSTGTEDRPAAASGEAPSRPTRSFVA